MADDTPASEFLGQFQAFVVFLGHLWGLLAGLSVFFRLSNVLLGLVPLHPYGTEGGVYDQADDYDYLVAVFDAVTSHPTSSGRRRRLPAQRGPHPDSQR